MAMASLELNHYVAEVDCIVCPMPGSAQTAEVSQDWPVFFKADFRVILFLSPV